MYAKSIVTEVLPRLGTALVCAGTLVILAIFMLHLGAFSIVLVSLQMILEGLIGEDLRQARTVQVDTLEELLLLIFLCQQILRH